MLWLLAALVLTTSLAAITTGGSILECLAQSHSSANTLDTTTPETAQQKESNRLLTQGLELLKNHRTLEAQKILKQAVALNPQSAVIHCDLGLAYQNSEQVDQAIAEYHQALQLQPHMKEAELNLACCLQGLAVGLLKNNRAFEARNLLEQAVCLDPESPAYRCDLGLAYQNSGNLNRALDEFNQALHLQPNMPEATLNLAGCLQSLGRTTDAINWYNKFIQDNPSAPQYQQVKDIVQALMATSQLPGSDPSLPDYLPSITHDGTYRWPRQKLPIKFYIQPGTRIEAFRDDFPRLLIESLDAWMEASQGRLSYTLVNTPQAADVVCSWTGNPAEVSDSGVQSERGLAQIFVQGNDINRATLKILTRPMITEGILSDDDFKKACLHETGHVLGLQGHSTNNHDVMFFTVDTSTVWPVLSKRDKLTISKLYADYPQTAAPPAVQH